MIDMLPAKNVAAMAGLAEKEGEGWWVPPRSAESFQVASAEDRDWINRRCVRHPFATMTQPLKLTGAWKTVRTKVYLRAAAYGASPFGPSAQKAKNDPGWRYEDIEAGHDVMIDAPDDLVDALIRASE
jgi:hypothetical protein